MVRGQTGYTMMLPGDDGHFFEVVFKGKAMFGKQSPLRHRRDISIQIWDGDSPVFSSPDFEAQIRKTGRYRIDTEGTIVNT